jgi:hypothetical protein
LRDGAELPRERGAPAGRSIDLLRYDPSVMRFASAMVSCPERAALRRRTLANLAATDWTEDVAVALDDGEGADRIARIDANWRKALRLAAASDADLILLMEDDLDFNRHLRNNLMTWPRLVGVDGTGPFFASLYNPGVYAVHSRPQDRYHVMAPGGCWGSQSLLISRALARYFLDHWQEEAGEPDIRMPRLAARFVPVYYHAPSLIQHVGHISTWGGRAHEAVDFDPEWRPSSGS